MAADDRHRSDRESREIPEKRLEGWKEIAAYLKRGVRTVQRWEPKGLPIHRHEATGTVCAYPSELDAWQTPVEAVKGAGAQIDQGQTSIAESLDTTTHDLQRRYLVGLSAIDRKSVV